MEFDDDSIMVQTSTQSSEKKQSTDSYATVKIDSLPTWDPIVTLSRISSETTKREKEQNGDGQKSFIPMPELYKDVTIVCLLAILLLRLLIDLTCWLKRKRQKKRHHFPMANLDTSASGSSVSVFNTSKLD